MDRYSRQMLLKEIGAKQKFLMEKKVLIIGVGALGTNSANLLVRAGVENLILVDNDKIEKSNLQRQTLFEEKDVGKEKTVIAKEKLEKIDSQANIEIIKLRINKNNIDQLPKVDLIIDCTDNLEARFVINKYCKTKKIPWVYSAAVKTHGYVMPILPDGPCLECFLKKAELDSACTVGVLNTIVTLISSLAVNLAIRILIKENVKPLLYYFDIWKMQFKEIKVNKKC